MGRSTGAQIETDTELVKEGKRDNDLWNHARLRQTKYMQTSFLAVPPVVTDCFMEPQYMKHNNMCKSRSVGQTSTFASRQVKNQEMLIDSAVQ
jgi:hypothetical protein